MDVKQAVDVAKKYVEELFANEMITDIDLEETEYDKAERNWRITLAFSRPWNTPRTRTQEILENLGAAPPGRRAYKVLTVAENGILVAMKNPLWAEMADLFRRRLWREPKPCPVRLSGWDDNLDRRGRTVTERTLRGKAAIVGIGETPYYKHGKSPDAEFKLALMAVVEACKDAGISPHDVDGFASYGNDRSDAGRLAAALGCREFRFSNMFWGGGGGGVCGAVANAAAAVATGMAECVVAFRSLAQGQYARYGRGAPVTSVGGDDAFLFPYGVMSPAQRFAMKITRFMHEHGIRQEALRAISLACYHHAQSNPRAVMHGKPLDAAKYDASRWIIEPFFHLYDCCLENDGAAAVIVVAADRAKDFPRKPAYLLGAVQGCDHRSAAPVHNMPGYPSSHFRSLAPHLYRMAKLGPADMQVVQCYENFTGGVLMSLVEHGLVKAEEANEVLVKENLIAPDGRMPLNTSGGNLAECYMHGLELVIEAIHQIRGDAINQLRKNDTAIVIGGPMVTPVSSLILGSEAAL